ncbi:MAG: glyceraldehyde 3-phosphate dehydrogenase NAD-binding domain-containing protein [Planctomycetota bacterium]
MAVRVGVNGFGRMGRLVARVAATRPELGLELVAVDEPAAGPEGMAVLLEFDSVQGRFHLPCRADGDALRIGDARVAWCAEEGIAPFADHGVDVVLECSGRRRKPELLQPFLDAGIARVVVSAPVSGDVPNVVVGVNEDAFDLGAAPLLSAASCTTNCLAPVVRVLHDAIGIERGLVTTIHDPTNTQRVVDAAHDDPRRARASGVNLVPTSTNSAHAVTRIVPELAGRLDSIAVRAPVLNASLVDAVFDVERPTTVGEVNRALEIAARSARLRGVLGYETRPLVSSDFARDPRSAIVDALSTRVTDGTLVKVLAWYDNEWGYVNRMAELAALASGVDPAVVASGRARA